jgi:hypothetical protein
MTSGRLMALAVLGAGFCLNLVAGVPAQDATTVPELTGYLQAALSQPVNAYMRMHQRASVAGVDQGEMITDMWLRDIDHFRTERDDGMVVVFTPEDVKMHLGQARVMLHVPKETLTEFGDNRGAALRQVGLSEPRLLVNAILSHSEALVITGEDVIGEEECWVLTASEKASPAWLAAFNNLPEGSHVISAEVALGKETGRLRGVHVDFAGPVVLELHITFPEVEEGIEIPDEALTFEPPEDTVIVEWTVGKSAGEVRDELQRAQAGQ